MCGYSQSTDYGGGNNLTAAALIVAFHKNCSAMIIVHYQARIYGSLIIYSTAIFNTQNR